VLKNYANAIFGSVIRDTLRQRHEVDICSDWGLLRKISQKRLQESLQADGLSAETVTSYIAAWSCFKSLYVPTQINTTRQLSRPDSQTWLAISYAYQTQTQSPTEPQTIEKWLLICAKAARRYLYPSVSSINVAATDDGSPEWIDNLTATDQESPLSAIISQEEEQTRNYQRSQINQILAACANQLEPQIQEILQLYYTQGRTQQQIAKELAIKQYTISRRLTKAKEILLHSLGKWSQETLHISVNSDLLNTMSVVMEEWLQSYYSQS
jgi:RNA polymerase sigma factor (sigma-70 family)